MHRSNCKEIRPVIELTPVVKNLPENSLLLFLGSDIKSGTFFLVYEEEVKDGEPKKIYYTGSAENMAEGQVSTPHARNGKVFVNCFYNRRALEFCVSNPRQSNIHGHPVTIHYP
jgi:hypothetical protein